ncbi:unnamed protein product [Thlaspi arvense]|uniref:Major facilitator superfamily (MFS) profile domain-containing protein n=1 Tax=Thlaspi arvense TaxID=13288 RepID=A0AAU9SFS1_THLAR|nr:unnamed protein product [Thlaspi arvense]
MVGLLIASPIFASLAKSFNPFRLIGVGLTVWTIAVLGCGSSFAFWFIVLCRMFVGVGEASFISLAAPFIDDNAPHKQKAVWLGVFYMCIPSGVALGYVYGGYVGKHFSWRYAFWGEAVLMAPFAVLGFLMKPLQLKGFPSTDSIKMASSVDAETSKNKNHLQAGGNEIEKNADMIFGAVTIICGISGTLSGGFILDRVTATIPNAFKLLTGATFLGAIFCFTAFTLKSLYGFITLFALGELLVFATQAPVNYVCLHCVKPSLRSLSMAISTVAIHIFGDVPSSPLVGIVQDHINNWRKTALILTSVLFLAAAIWFIGIFINSVDRCNEEESEHVCRPEQRDALLEFKNKFEIRKSSFDRLCHYSIGGAAYPKTESWKHNSDCCYRDGITCDAKSGEVIKLDLSCSGLHGSFRVRFCLQLETFHNSKLLTSAVTVSMVKSHLLLAL